MSIKKLREQCKLANAKWVARGYKLAIYQCQHCKEEIPKPRPDKAMVSGKGFWDSATICTNCGKLNFVAIWPSGRTAVNKIE